MCKKGVLINLYGPSGSGKSTFIRKLIQQGNVSRFFSRETNISSFGRMCGKCSLSSMPIPAFRGDLLEYFNLFCINNISATEVSLSLQKLMSTVRECKFNNNDLSAILFHELSAGEQRRAGIVRAILAQQSFLIVDEPYANSDRSLYLTIDNAISTTSNVIIITHSPIVFQEKSTHLVNHVEVNTAHALYGDLV